MYGYSDAMRLFDGKYYKLALVVDTKGQASKDAIRLRKRPGHKVRITPAAAGMRGNYALWVRYDPAKR